MLLELYMLLTILCGFCIDLQLQGSLFLDLLALIAGYWMSIVVVPNCWVTFVAAVRHFLCGSVREQSYRDFAKLVGWSYQGKFSKHQKTLQLPSRSIRMLLTSFWRLATLCCCMSNARAKSLLSLVCQCSCFILGWPRICWWGLSQSHGANSPM